MRPQSSDSRRHAKPRRAGAERHPDTSAAHPATHDCWRLLALQNAQPSRVESVMIGLISGGPGPSKHLPPAVPVAAGVPGLCAKVPRRGARTGRALDFPIDLPLDFLGVREHTRAMRFMATLLLATQLSLPQAGREGCV